MIPSETRLRLVGVDGADLGTVPLAEAIRLARASRAELAEVFPFADPPLCRLMDHGERKYLLAKGEQVWWKRQRGEPTRRPYGSTEDRTKIIPFPFEKPSATQEPNR